MTQLTNPPTIFDTIFAARATAAIANTGFRVGGSDIATLYERLSSGDPIEGTTGFTINGVDLAAKFAALGTLTTPWSAQTLFNNTHVSSGTLFWDGTYYHHINSAYSGGYYFSYLRSADGVNWGNHTISGTYIRDLIAHKLATNGSRIVATGSVGANYFSHYSDDNGATWTLNTTAGSDFTPSDVLWTGTHFVTIGYNGSIAGVFSRSAAGLTWSAIASLNGDTSRFGNAKICYNGSSVITALGVDTTAGAIKRTYSTDNGATWSAYANLSLGSLTPAPDIIGQGAIITGIVWTGTGFVAIGTASVGAPLLQYRAFITRSADGITWDPPQYIDGQYTHTFTESLIMVGTQVLFILRPLFTYNLLSCFSGDGGATFGPFTTMTFPTWTYGATAASNGTGAVLVRSQTNTDPYNTAHLHTDSL
jgi:hypothetical protein